jgi:hypothetical protein
MMMKIDELYFRRAFCQKCIHILDEMTEQELSDLNIHWKVRREAMDEYKRQLAEIDRQITEIEGTPPPVVVGLQTASLFGKADMKQGD